MSGEEFSRHARRYASVRDVSAWVPNFPGRRGLARLCDLLSYALHPQARKGIPRSFNSIGNAWPLSVPGKAPRCVTIRYPVLARSKAVETRVVLDPAAASSADGPQGAT